MERLLAFANLKSEPPLKTDNDKHIIQRAAVHATLKVTDADTPREKTDQQRQGEELLLGTEHTVPAELEPLIRDIARGLGFKRQVRQIRPNLSGRSCLTYACVCCYPILACAALQSFVFALYLMTSMIHAARNHVVISMLQFTLVSA